MRGLAAPLAGAHVADCIFSNSSIARLNSCHSESDEARLSGDAFISRYRTHTDPCNVLLFLAIRCNTGLIPFSFLSLTVNQQLIKALRSAVLLCYHRPRFCHQGSTNPKLCSSQIQQMTIRDKRSCFLYISCSIIFVNL